MLCLKLPPIFNALSQNTPAMEETIRFIVKHDKEFYIPVKCSVDKIFVNVKLKNDWTNMFKYGVLDDLETDIIGEAVSRGHSLNLIKFLISEMKVIEENDIEKGLGFDSNVLVYSIQRNDLEIFKFFDQ